MKLVKQFFDSEYETWNMSPEALERAFEILPDVRRIIVAHPMALLERWRKSEKLRLNTKL